MGQTAVSLPHETRSSSRTFAKRLKHENARFIRNLALGAALLVFMFLLMLYGTSMKQIELVVNGESRIVTTRQWELDRLLAEQNIAIGPHDRLSVPAHGKLQNGDRLVIEHTHPITLIEGGAKAARYTIGKTVREALADMNIALGELDRTEPSLEANISPGSMVRIVRVSKTLEVVEKEIPFKVVTKSDNTLAKGKEKIVQEGKQGVLLETIEKIFEDGVLASSRVLDTTISEQSVNKLVAVGTKKPVTVLSASSPTIEHITKKGMTFGVKQILTGVTLTAYDAGLASTGKDVNHPQYGITYSGTKVKEGRTIAVDPKVIPMGWWVYIEGYGFRRAEDKGSAIKGKKIDIYFEDANKSGFGKKKGVTVYVIGPNKPETN